MTIYDELARDHVKVLHLFDDLLALPHEDQERHSEIIAKIRDDLIPHSRAEEAVLYNSLRSLEAARDIVSHSYKEHIEVETLLRALQVRDSTHMEWRKTALGLRQTLLHHIQEEEGKIFPMAKQLFTEMEAEMMASAFKELKPQIKEEGIATTTLELVANAMPPRFAKYMKSFNLDSRL